MTITARIVCDAISENGDRLTTFELRYPRFIHSEFMTHRVFSRNASSSRAIPVKRLIDDVMNDCAMPIHWGKNQKGMQADEEHDALLSLPINREERDDYTREAAWLYARDHAVFCAKKYDEAGYHKQVVNRLLEPFSHINVVVTSTSFKNFFKLRYHKDAQPEIHELAKCMWEVYYTSKPKVLKAGDWYLPYADDDATLEGLRAVVTSNNENEYLKKISAARCARVSYKTHDGRISEVEEDLELYDRLVGGEPIHASPVEHQATPDRLVYRPFMGYIYEKPEFHGNFRGWIQARKLLPNESGE